MKTGLSGLGGKHPKPAGLALKQVKGQGETAEVERRQRGTDKGENKESQGFFSGKSGDRNHGFCKGNKQVRHKCQEKP